MKKIKYIIAFLSIIAIAPAAKAQTGVSSYFLDGAYHNYKLNPAMKAERGMFSLLLGNFSLRTNGNVGISDFLYPYGNDKLTTFMSGTVDQDDFLGRLPDYARIGMNLDESIMEVGFRMLGGYTTLGLSMHSSLSMALPKGFFEFAKKGMQESAYDFSNLNLNTMNYAAITLGYSHEIFKGFRIGANLKYLMGLAYADITVDKLNVELSDKRWMVSSHAQAQVALFCESQADLDGEGVVQGIEMGAMSPSAMGFAVDLGAVYDMNHIVPGLTLSASFVDLGYINWKYMLQGQSVDAKVEFDGFDEIDPNDMETSINNELERLGDDASKLVDFTYDGTSAMKTMLASTMYLGAEYNMPFYKPLSVGVLYGQRFSPLDYNKWFDVRGFLNISPCSWFEATVNYGYSTYGASLGWMLNFHPVGVNLFVGSDFMITKVTPQYIPVDDLNAHVTIGLSLALGKRK